MGWTGRRHARLAQECECLLPLRDLTAAGLRVLLAHHQREVLQTASSDGIAEIKAAVM